MSFDTKKIDEIIVGRVIPHIYAFSTNTIPNYLKVGDTYRTVESRLKEWEHQFSKTLSCQEDFKIAPYANVVLIYVCCIPF